MNINSVCRTCLREDGEMQSIFCPDSTKSLSNMITACTVTKVSQQDGLPAQICLHCIQIVTASYDFKQKCESAYETLKHMFGHPDETSFSSDKSSSLNESTDQLLEETFKKSSEIIDFNSDYDTVKMESENINNIKPNEKCIQTEEICFYNCEMCSQKFINEDALKIHRAMHKDSGFKCRECSKVYTRLTHLRRHICASHPNILMGKEADEILCTVCNKQFTRTDHLRRHMQTHHVQSDVPKQEHDRECFKCNNCNQLFKVEDDYLKHENCTKERTSRDSDDFSDEKEPITKEEYLSDGNEETNILDALQVELVKAEQLSDAEDDPDFRPDLNDDSFHGDDDDNGSSNSSDDATYMPTSTPIAVASSSSSVGVKTKRRGRPKKSIPKDYAADLSELKVEDATKVIDKILKAKATHRCPKCDKTFTRATHLKRHLIIHSDVKPFSCEVCEKKFSRIDHLNIHRFHHLDVKPHTCDICQRGFTRAEHLRKHKESRHGDKTTQSIKTEFCEICQKGFTTPKYLQVHMRSHTDRVFQCKFCDEKFGSKSDLNEHTKKHVNERPFLCSECGLRFVRNDYLVIHMRRHKGEKPYKCKYCGKGFPRATDLTVHERYHTGEKTHLCTICGKGFQRAYNLLVHTRVHTGERPYQCPHCVKSFAQGNDLKAHIRRHTGERYKCDVCGDGFIQGYHLTQHKRTVHGIDMKSHIRRVEKFIPAVPKPDGDGELQQQMHDMQQMQLQHLHKLQQDSIMMNVEGKMETAEEEPLSTAIQPRIKIEPQLTHLTNDSHVELSDSQSSDITILQPHSHQSQLSHLQHMQPHNLVADPNATAGLMAPSMAAVNFISSIHQKMKLHPQSFQ